MSTTTTTHQLNVEFALDFLVLCNYLVALDHDNVGNPEDEVEHEQDHHHQNVPQLVPNLGKSHSESFSHHPI